MQTQGHGTVRLEMNRRDLFFPRQTLGTSMKTRPLAKAKSRWIRSMAASSLEAMTGPGARRQLNADSRRLRDLAGLLKVPAG